MRVERDGRAFGPGRSCLVHRTSQDALMTQVDAIEDPDRHHAAMDWGLVHLVE
jgi:hypothetical protein